MKKDGRRAMNERREKREGVRGWMEENKRESRQKQRKRRMKRRMGERDCAKRKANSTRCSRAVTHHSTNPA